MITTSLPSFVASKDMNPTQEERGLRAFVLCKTLMTESLKFLRHFCDRVARGDYGVDAQVAVGRLSNEFTFSQCLKEITVAQMHLTLSEQDICDEEWFNEFITGSAWLLDQMVLASPVHEILTTVSMSENGICAQVGDSIMRAAGLRNCKNYWTMRDEISRYIEHSAPLRQRLLQYALTQESSILNDYVYTIQLFDAK
ncbi:MAG: hypothetical protein K2X77_12555 [Candidatus Obscuribacterales bacterium]|jgi:hypothetical protein|nr:hypothetical protein [Candidatus Obscuribacterales bacterium]